MFIFLLTLFVTIFASSQGNLEIVSREEWHAQPPKEDPEPMSNPVPYVVIHHSFTPPACITKETCIEAMQTMQFMHQITNGWNDIGYNFAVGSDGLAYEGRSWNNVGAHAPGYNTQSIGICTIGDWTLLLPPQKQLKAIKELIELGVSKGYIAENYKLIGHRQAKNSTECPGETLFYEIQTWEHFEPHPIPIISNKINTQKINKDSGAEKYSGKGFLGLGLIFFLNRIM